LKNVLAFKGGTALNKIYFGKFSRLSVDLDFNLIGPPREVVKQGAPIRKAIEAILREQDPGYEFKFSYRADQTTLLARYAPASGGAEQPLKIELSMRESVPVMGLIEKSIPTETRVLLLLSVRQDFQLEGAAGESGGQGHRQALRRRHQAVSSA
jgi:predicted nucleotidyltransferase component of viral defense system